MAGPGSPISVQDLTPNATSFLTVCCQIDNALLAYYVRCMTPRLHASGEPKSRLCQAYTDLLIEVFRLNGDQLAIGNALGADVELTSARWQVLGAISLSSVALPVPHIARNMGLTRQAVQRSVDEMRADDLVRLEVNPHHRRAMLVAMTEKGEAAYRFASERHGQWVEALMADLSPESIDAASELLRAIQRRIESSTTVATKVQET